MRRAALLLLAVLAAPARADLLMGEVVAVSDGDSLRVADARSRVQFPVRLAGIRAPARTGADGKRAHQALGALLFGKNVQVEGRFTDRGFHGRVLVAAPGCRAATCPRDLDAGLEQLRAGMAWWDPRDGALSAARRAEYEQAEFQAKIHRQGLWAGRNTLPPWGP